MNKIKKGALLYFLIGGVIFLLTLFFIFPLFKHVPQPRLYSYYKIIDMDTGKILMYVSSAPVNKGDELITSDNRRFVVVKVKGNKAYAEYIEKVKLEP